MMSVFVVIQGMYKGINSYDVFTRVFTTEERAKRYIVNNYDNLTNPYVEEVGIG